MGGVGQIPTYVRDSGTGHLRKSGSVSSLFMTGIKELRRKISRNK
jgi:hypothetical protein